MNITGYKKKYKSIRDTLENTEKRLKAELSKPDYKRNDFLIKGLKAKSEVLYKAKSDCSKKIKILQKKRLSELKSRKKRFRHTTVKGRRRTYAKD